MERRDKSLNILRELNYIDSLDSYERADALVSWYNEHFPNGSIDDIDLEIEDLKRFEELFFRNLEFLKKQQELTRIELNNMKKLKSFLKN